MINLFKKITGYLKMSWIYITILVSTLCCAAILFHIEKLNIIWKENIPLSSVLLNRTSLIVFIFFTLSLVMFSLKELGIKSFTESQVNSFLSWFTVAMTTSITHSLYVFTASLHKALYYDSPKDILLGNDFFVLLRKWDINELLLILNKYLSSVGVSWSELEKTNLCSSVNNVSDLLEKASIICSEKLALIEAQIATKNSYWSFFNDTFNSIGSFAYNHKGLVLCVGTLVSGVALYSLVQNFGFQVFTSRSLRDVSDSVSNLSRRITNIDNNTERNAESIRLIEQSIRNVVNNTNQSLVEMRQSFLMGLANCADMAGTNKVLQELSATLANSNLEATAQRYAIIMVVESLLRNGLLDQASAEAIREFCQST